MIMFSRREKFCLKIRENFMPQRFWTIPTGRHMNTCVRWSLDWRLPFSVSQCKVVHLDHCNPNHSYAMAGTTLDEIH